MSDSAEVASTYNNIGSLYFRMGKYEQALGPDHRENVHVYMNLGDDYRELGDDAQALAHSRKALGIAEAEFERTHPSVAALSERVEALCRQYEPACSP